MKRQFILFVLLAGLPVADLAADEPAFDPTKVSEIDAIACRLDAPGFNGFAGAMGDADGIAATRHWVKQDTHDPFLDEYELPAPITVAGHYTTRRIGFSAGGVVAILDEPDASVIAKAEDITNAMDPEPLIAALVAEGKVPRAQAEASIKFRKFMGEKVELDKVELPAKGESFGFHTTISHSIANATTYPGKTLYGCSYRMEMIGADGKPL